MANFCLKLYGQFSLNIFRNHIGIVLLLFPVSVLNTLLPTIKYHLST